MGVGGRSDAGGERGRRSGDGALRDRRRAGGQVREPAAVIKASDIGGPYAAIPPEAAMPRPAPALLPPREIYGLLRDDGFAPLGTPGCAARLHGRGDRPGRRGRPPGYRRPHRRIVRFIPATPISARRCGAARRRISARSVPAPRPPRSVPQVASRTRPPLPKAAPPPTGRRAG